MPALPRRTVPVLVPTPAQAQPPSPHALRTWAIVMLLALCAAALPVAMQAAASVPCAAVIGAMATAPTHQPPQCSA